MKRIDWAALAATCWAAVTVVMVSFGLVALICDESPMPAVLAGLAALALGLLATLAAGGDRR